MAKSHLSFKGSLIEAELVAAKFKEGGVDVEVTSRGDIQIILFQEPEDPPCRVQLQRAIEAQPDSDLESS